jgi:hypothetical protein
MDMSTMDAVAIFNQLSKSQRELVARVLIKAHLEEALSLVVPFLVQKQKQKKLSRTMSYHVVRKGFVFSLQNGLRAQLYRLDNSQVSEIAEILSSSSSHFKINWSSRRHYHLIKVVVAGQEIYLLKGYMNQLVLHTFLTNNLEFALTSLDALVYDKKVYRKYTEMAKLLQTSILQKTNPSIARIVFL